MNRLNAMTHCTDPAHVAPPHRRRVIGFTVLAAVLVVNSLVQQPLSAGDTYTLQAKGWQKQPTPDPASPEGQLRAIRQTLAQDRPEQALTLADQWLEHYPNHPLAPQAYLIRGDAKTATHAYYNALFDYEHVIRSYPASELLATVLDRELQIARLFASGVKRKLWGMRILSADGEAEEIFIRIQERAPGSATAEKASLALGDFYFERSQMVSAVDAYDLFLSNYPQSRHREKAARRMIHAGLATFKGPRFDPTGLIDAAQRIKDYQDQFPQGADRADVQALLVRINELQAQKTRHLARWYEQRGDPVAAAYLWRRIIRDYPQTTAARSALQRLTDLGMAAVPSGEGPPREPAESQGPETTASTPPRGAEP